MCFKQLINEPFHLIEKSFLRTLHLSQTLLWNQVFVIFIKIVNIRVCLQDLILKCFIDHLTNVKFGTT